MLVGKEKVQRSRRLLIQGMLLLVGIENAVLISTKNFFVGWQREGTEMLKWLVLGIPLLVGLKNAAVYLY